MAMKKILTLSFLLSAVVVFAVGQVVWTQVVVAQDFSSSVGTTADVAVEFSPSAPGPNQSVTATATSYSVDLNSSSISWSMGGKKQSSGNGLTTFSFTTGSLNQTTTIDVTITAANGQVIQKTFSIKPADVDLIWQAQSHTPPFYEGKPLFSHEELLEFVAIPHIIGSNGAEIPARNLIYKWTRNGYVVGDFSGYGKSTYTMLASIISVPIDMQVEVTTPDGTGIADAEVTAAPVTPQIVFYRRDPLYGLQFQNALPQSLALTGSEMDVLGEPFYFATDDISAGNLQYTWSENGQQIDSDLSKTDRVFRPANGTSGTANISLSITNTNKILQTADGSFNLSFSSPK
jgi:hypothetical protein